MSIDWHRPCGLKITVMGLGLHGGGLASAFFFASRGATVTVTDLAPACRLRDPVAELEGLPVRLVLGRHEERDFTDTDLVIKNPAVPSDSALLRLARRRHIPIETDVSVFLRLCANPLIAVTGSKGKSTIVSAIHHCLTQSGVLSRLGGNITVSPLSFVSDLPADAPVVLELSSWQLSDLKGKGVLEPRIAMISNILPDHMNRYPDMAAYIADKKIIFQGQTENSCAVFNLDDPTQASFPRETSAKPYFFSADLLPQGMKGAHLTPDGGTADLAGHEKILPHKLRVLGEHNRLNLLAAGLAVRLFGLDAGAIRDGMATFKGIEHRLELVAQVKGIRFYNDSASTIPQATVCAVRSVPGPILLIAGGTDKELDFASFRDVVPLIQGTYLLAGSATDKMAPIFREMGSPFAGPFDNLDRALAAAVNDAPQGSAVLLSPGCTSFEMFANEFDRGRQFKKLVGDIASRA